MQAKVPVLAVYRNEELGLYQAQNQFKLFLAAVAVHVHTVQLIVNDGEDDSAPDTVKVSVGQDIPGNLDGDDDVDIDDMMIIMAARNTEVDEDDPRDLDGDGMITVLDMRKLVLLRTRPGCATE